MPTDMSCCPALAGHYDYAQHNSGGTLVPISIADIKQIAAEVAAVIKRAEKAEKALRECQDLRRAEFESKNDGRLF